MANTFFGLTIGKSGLYAYQAALNTTAHNASNADTNGYSRQSVERAASKAISVSSTYGMQGTGVNAGGVVQIRDAYYDTKYWKNNAIYGNYNTKAYYLDNVQSYFSEVTSKGSTAALDSVFTSLSSLSNSVGDLTIRTQVTENSLSLTDTINSLYDNLQTLQKECNEEIKNTADQINSISQRIASLTKQINTIEIKGVSANDLRDARNLLIDELSQLANTNVSESPIGDDIGVNQYVVRLNGKILVDTYEYKTLKAVPKDTDVTLNDVDGLYNITWSDGQTFDSNSPTLGGKLQALFQMRDGNNKLNFTGKATTDPADATAGTAGSTKLVVSGSNINDIIKLNIADNNGNIIVGSREYKYNSFEVKVEADGSYTYTFELAEALKESSAGKGVRIGESVDCKGIPYYQAQLNEFARTLAKTFNDIHREGEDLNGDKGLDFFTATQLSTGDQFSFEVAFAGLSSTLGAAGADGYVKASYYHMTAGNLTVTKAILDNPKKIACAAYDGDVDTGIEDKSTLEALLALRQDMSMFKQGSPDMFLQTIVGEMGIDTKTAVNFAQGQDDILKLIQNQRASVSGVDKDEEALDLVKFKNAYNLCSKVISTMNEIYDKLINSTGV